MVNSILSFKRNATLLGLCGIYKSKWDNCKTPKELVDLALDANGVEFIADSIAFDWGISPKYIYDNFLEYQYYYNKYVRIGDGYTSSMFTQIPLGEIFINTTITLIIDCAAYVHIPDNFIGKIYVCGGSHLHILNLNEKVELCIYGNDNVIELANDCKSIKVNKKEIFVSQWVKS